MPDVLTCPRQTFRHLTASLQERSPVYASLGTLVTSERREWLMRSEIPGVPPSGGPYLVFHSGAPPPFPHWFSTTGPAVVHLFLGSGAFRGHLAGVVAEGGFLRPLQSMQLVGAGMHSVPLSPEIARADGRVLLADLERAENAASGLMLSRPARRLEVVREASQAPKKVTAPELGAEAIWSRTIGALGGHATWERLRGLRLALVGCGRTGSLMAEALVRTGFRDISLLDPDVVEAHNLGEAATFVVKDVGRHKVSALRDHLLGIADPLGMAARIEAVVGNIWDLRGARTARDAELIVTCVDNDRARLSAALVATIYHRALLDVGTGIRVGRNGEQEQGCDVRLVVPGTGCLLCNGGNLSDFDAALNDLCHFRQPGGGSNWQSGRTGSLRSQNETAVGLARQLLEGLLTERVQATTWHHVSLEATGPSIETRAAPPDPNCDLCRRAGWGDLSVLGKALG